MLVALKRAVFGEQTVEGEIHVQGLYMMLKMTWSECKCDKISYVTRENGQYDNFALDCSKNIVYVTPVVL